MGNSGSGQGIVDEPIPSPIVGGNPGRLKSKVLPDLTPAHRLRPTDNGAILHNGGTISTRKQMERRKQSMDDNHHIEIKRDFYGSEPDLRYTGRLGNFINNDSPSKVRISRSRKKYKAPVTPINNTQISGDSSSPDSFQEWENSMINGQPSRRLRLFKTRAETRKKINENNLHNLHSYLPSAGTLQRSLSTPQFHAELLEAAEKLRPVREPPVGKANDNSSSSPVGGYRSLDSCKERLSYGRGYDVNHYDISPLRQMRDERIKAEGCNTNDFPLNELWHAQHSKPHGPVKTFYFGMNANGEVNESTVVDKFAAKLQHLSQSPLDMDGQLHSTEYYEDIIANEKKGGISVQLRATLPRKQLDIPRFSPTTAWRLLSTLDSPPPSEEDDLVQFEHRLLAPPLPIHIPVQMDKSADSGISGDASPQHHDSTHNSQAAWTPQQDLEETSSDGGFPCQPVSPDQCSTAKFSPRFTLSLPRDDRIKLYGSSDKDGGTQSSLDGKKLRRKGSGVFGKVTLEKDENHTDESLLLDSNWVLSRSVPNSLNYANISLSRWNHHSPDMPDEEEELSPSLIKQPSFSYLATGGHIMYLPEYSKPRDINDCVNQPVFSHQTLSKSCEDLSRNIDEPISINTSEPLDPPKTKRGKKFTFQSTVRQIERKRLAEKLSRQVEHKEKERKCELEAMRKVEEEFQRKREREKADIRQQLRLYTITQNSSKNSSPDLPQTQVLSEFRQQQREYKEYRPQRRPLSEMDTVIVNDSNTKRATVHPKVVYQIPKSTQVYVTSRLTGSQPGSPGLDCSDQVVAQTPTSDNYRKHFAQGALPNSLINSESDKTRTTAGKSSRNCDVSSREKYFKNNLNEKGSTSSYQPTINLGITEIKTVVVTQDMQMHSSNSEETNHLVPSFNQVPLLGVNSLKPFERGKTYKPIQFNPGRNQVAQFAN